ncbi:MAG TPA: MFS transporter [Terriglobia bacterium]|nr:MFS transporter [Terriglobia bacterium]
MADTTELQASRSSMPAPWIVGMAVFPFGLVVGFTITALPFLLTHLGVSLDKVAVMSATVMTPTFWGFLLQPLMDTGLTRRAYAWITAACAAICLAAALFVLSPVRLGPATGLLLIGELSIVLYSGAIGGWTAQFTPDHLRGSVSGWTNVANLGGGALGSLAVMSLAPHVALHWLGLGLAVCIIISTLPILFFPEAVKSSFRLRQIFTDTLKTTWQASKTKEVLTGFCLFLVPASAEAAINLFSGMGNDFHTSASTVIWVTGGGCAITASIGALLGGRAANRVSRGYLYLGAGLTTSIVSLAMAIAPRVPLTFILGALVYNGLAGVCYAAFNALGFQLVGQESPVASTQLGLFAAATNFAIDYMTWADGLGFKHFGVRGLLLTDGLASMISALVLLALLGSRLRKRHIESYPVTAAAD